jgi:hypothetical protein
MIGNPEFAAGSGGVGGRKRFGPAGCPRRGSEKFSNDWKKVFQWLEKMGGFFQ